MAKPNSMSNRYDVFRDAKPYYGVPLLEVRDKVPTLFSCSVRCVFEKKIQFSEAPELPSVMKSRLEYLKRYMYGSFAGPRVMKCSNCNKFYTHKKRFFGHNC